MAPHSAILRPGNYTPSLRDAAYYFTTHETDTKNHGGNYRRYCRRDTILGSIIRPFVGMLLRRSPYVINPLNTQEMKTATEKTLITALVNLKCLGHFGRCLRAFNRRERVAVIDALISRGWIDEHYTPTAAAAPIVLANLNLCQY